MKNIIDPGHGGPDSGAVGAIYEEKDLNLDVCKKISKKFNCKLTRDKDVLIGLSTRGNMARNGNLFASIHFNSWKRDSTGCEVYYSVDLPGDKVHAEKIARELSIALGVPNRGAKTRESAKYVNEDYYTVIDSAQDSGCAHVFLVECGYISNPVEEKKMNTTVIADVLGRNFNEILGISAPVNTVGEWKKINGDWTFFQNENIIKNDWVLNNGVWYWIKDNYEMARNEWCEIKGKWYCFNKNGVMYCNTTTPDGYRVDVNGEWIK